MNNLYEGLKKVLQTLPEWDEFNFSFEKKADNTKISIRKAGEEINFKLKKRLMEFIG